MCKMVIQATADGDDDLIIEIYEKNPKLKEEIISHALEPGVIVISEPEESCIRMDLCSDKNIMDLLAEE